MRKAELVRVSHHSKDVWLINYKLWWLCGCRYDRFVLQHKGQQPTEEEAKTIIDEDKNKR